MKKRRSAVPPCLPHCSCWPAARWDRTTSGPARRPRLPTRKPPCPPRKPAAGKPPNPPSKPCAANGGSCSATRASSRKSAARQPEPRPPGPRAATRGARRLLPLDGRPLAPAPSAARLRRRRQPDHLRPSQRGQPTCGAAARRHRARSRRVPLGAARSADAPPLFRCRRTPTSLATGAPRRCLQRRWPRHQRPRRQAERAGAAELGAAGAAGRRRHHLLPGARAGRRGAALPPDSAAAHRGAATDPAPL